MSDTGGVVTWSDTSLSSSNDSFGGRVDCFGQSAGDCLSQVEPFHQSGCCRSSDGLRPLEAQSVGLSRPLT